MSYNGSGGYSPAIPPDFPAVAGQLILAAQFNNTINDIATALSNVLVRDGQAPMIGSLNMGGYKIANAAIGTASGDLATVGQSFLAKAALSTVDWNTITANGFYDVTVASTSGGSSNYPSGSLTGELLVMNNGLSFICQVIYSPTRSWERTKVGASWGSWIELAQYQASGNLLVGTQTDDGFNPLQINKTALISNITGNGAALTLLSSSGGSGGTGIFFRPYQNSAQNLSVSSQASITSIDNNFSADLIFSSKIPGVVTNAATEKMRLNASGNLSLGTAADSTSGPKYAVLQLKETSSSGVYLGNTANSAANVLDWYEEGTFTPIVSGTAPVGVGTYTKQFGKFTRIGNMCTVQIELTWSAHTGAGGGSYATFSGWPYVPATGGGDILYMIQAPGTTSTGSVQVLRYTPGATSAQVYGTGNSGSTGGPTALPASGYMSAIFTFFV